MNYNHKAKMKRKQQKKNDMVNSPKHYTSHPSGVECITITRHMGFNIGNVFKYLWRNGLKDGSPALEELKKAAWYLNDEILLVEGAQKKLHKTVARVKQAVKVKRRKTKTK